MPPEILPPRTGKGLRTALLVAVLAAVAIAATGILGRKRNHAELERWAAEHAVPHVSVVTPQRPPEAGVITLPGRLRAYYHAPIHARVNGTSNASRSISVRW